MDFNGCCFYPTPFELISTTHPLIRLPGTERRTDQTTEGADWGLPNLKWAPYVVDSHCCYSKMIVQIESLCRQWFPSCSWLSPATSTFVSSSLCLHFYNLRYYKTFLRDKNSLSLNASETIFLHHRTWQPPNQTNRWMPFLFEVSRRQALFHFLSSVKWRKLRIWIPHSGKLFRLRRWRSRSLQFQIDEGVTLGTDCDFRDNDHQRVLALNGHRN